MDEIIERLGSGYEGEVFRVRNMWGYERVVKRMHIDRRFMLQGARKFAEMQLVHPSLYKIEVTQSTCEYIYEHLCSVESDFTLALKQIAELQSFLCDNGIVYFDLGINESNFMFDCNNQIKLIDYGGFIWLQDESLLHVPEWVRLAVWNGSVNNELLQTMLLLFILRYNGTKNRSITLLNRCLRRPERISRIKRSIIRSVRQTPYVYLVHTICQQDLRMSVGWLRVQQRIIDEQKR